MKVIFLDFDGVLNSLQSFKMWEYKKDQSKWETEMYAGWKGSMREYLAMEFCPICFSNMEELVRRNPDVKIVISSSWRQGETVESLKQILFPSKLISEAVIDVTESFSKIRGEEIQKWLNEHPEVTKYVIVDDDSEMLDSQKENFVKTTFMHGFQYGDMLWADRILGKRDKT